VLGVITETMMMSEPILQLFTIGLLMVMSKDYPTPNFIIEDLEGLLELIPID